MRSLFKIKKGFTLAEVLIVLAMIGVIASMTIPTLMQSQQTKSFRTSAKKMYSTLKQAVGIAKANNGNSYVGITRDDIIENLIIIKDCNNGAFNGCISEADGYEPLGGGERFHTGVWDIWQRTVILNSGASVTLFWFTDDCSLTTSIVHANYCGRMHFDVNGPAKPNEIGQDVYGVLLTRDYGLMPYGADGIDDAGRDDDNCVSGSDTKAGYSCMIKVLMNEDY